MIRSWTICLPILAVLAGASFAADAPESAPYPIGVVIGPRNNAQPSREEQQFFYGWAAQLGFNAIEHEMLPIAGGWTDWAEVEPKPGEFKWDPYDFAVADAEAAGLDIYPEIFPWKTPPAWLFERNPDMYMQTPLAGGDELTKVIRDPKLDTNTFPTLAHPQLIAAAEKYVGALASRYKDRKRVRGYIIGEELGLSGIWPPTTFYGIDFSPAMRDAYHAHLKKKFKTISALNAAWKHPDRYKEFSEIVWKRQWAHEPKEYRGEWLEYYRCLQFVVAEYYNRVARAIRAADPDAIVMVSSLDTLGNRVGHGAYLPLLKDVQASAYKSYWQDNRWNADLNASGGHEVWCSNFTEAETTRGGIQQRYLASPYIRRQFFPAYARGLKGAFLFVFTPDQPEKMSLLEPQANGSLEPIAAIRTCQTLIQFLARNEQELSRFAPEPPRIIALDPNTTFIGQQWDFADTTKERVQWHDQTPAIQGYIDVLSRIAQANRRFAVTTEAELAAALKNPTAKVLCLASNDLLDESLIPVVQQWITAGKPVIADHRTATFNELSQPSKALAGFLSRPNVLVLQGNKWAQDQVQQGRLRKFLDQHIPLRYHSRDNAGPEVFTVDYMTAPTGDELAVAIRNGPMGQPSRKLDIELTWKTAHSKVTQLDPFAIESRQVKELGGGGKTSTVVTMEGYQDAVLIVAK